MSYRKGEFSPAAIDLGWPYQVAIKAYLCTGKHYDDHKELCRNLSLCLRGHSVMDGDIAYRVFCFSDAEHARLFQEAFNGLPFYPEDRGRGANWMAWDRPPGDIRRTPAPAKQLKARLWR